MMSDSSITGTNLNKSVSELSFPISTQEICLEFRDTLVDAQALWKTGGNATARGGKKLKMYFGS